MKTKLLLWITLSLLILAIVVGVINAALGNGQVAIWCAVVAAFLGFAASILTGDLDRFREAHRNDRDWRIHPRL